MKSILILAAILLLLMSVSSEAEHWVFITESQDSHRLYIDMDRMSRYEGFIRLWSKIEETHGDKILKYSEFDCKGQRMRLLQTISYIGGAIPTSQTFPPGQRQWYPTKPATTEYMELNYVCRNLDKERYSGF